MCSVLAESAVALAAGTADMPVPRALQDADSPVRISAIVPIYNNAGPLAQCLSALRAAAGSETELIVVDDASSDDVASVASRFGARILRLDKNSGPAAARNLGARYARGEILFFVDGDVVVGDGAIGQVRSVLDNNEDISAVFGSYDQHPAAPGLVSQYRNLLHHFVHQTSKTEATTFWAGCGA